MRSQFWHNALKKIIFKNIYEELDKNTQLLITATENNNKNSENINEILEKSNNQFLKKYLSDQISTQISEFVEQFSEKSKEKYENFIKQNKELNLFYIKQNRIEKADYIKQSYEQNLQYIRQNKRHFTEYIDKTFGQIRLEVIEFIEQISEIGMQNKKEYENLIMQNKKQYTEFLRENKERHRDLIRNLSDILDKKTTKLIKQISIKVDQKNDKLLEKISENINNQISRFTEKTSHEINRQNSVFIKQNTELIKQILSQSLQNHGTIDKKFGELVSYQTLSEFRENLITIKSTIVTLQKLDNTQLKIFRNLYLKYHTLHSEIPTLDVTQGILIIKILFPSFFTQMLYKLSIIKSQFEEDVYTEIKDTINYCYDFFQNFKPESDILNKIKKMINSDLNTVDDLLIKLTRYG